MNEKTYPDVHLPEIPRRDVSIADFGAIAGGLMSNTKAIKDAVSYLTNQGGGRVIIPAGIWLTGPVELKSRINLHLEKGALLLFNYNPEEYPLIKTSYEGGNRIRAISPLNARDEEDIAITGEGVIDGSGQRWRPVKKFKLTEAEWKKLIDSGGVVENHMWYPSQSSYDGNKNPAINPDDENALELAQKYYDYYRPVMVSLIKCKRVLIEGVTLQNSPAWNVHPLFCEHFTMRNATIRNPWNSANGDGLDLESCRFANIINISFDVGDDAICMKAGKNAEARKTPIPTEYVTIRNCTVYHGHGGFVVGSEMSRGVRNIIVEDCTFIGTDTGIRFKSTLGRGGVVENITLKNINMINIKEQAFIFSMAYSGGMDRSIAEPEDVPEFKNIHMQDIVCCGAGQAILITGLDNKPVHDLLFKNVTIKARRGIFCEKADKIHFVNTKLVNEADPEKEVFYEDFMAGDGFVTDF